ncbi:SapC family protein [Luteimonas sp. TWI1416]|uniref:SapC family protein n=1 Tax=unclassified Luteimonas TaxID=2629088 RepID=UPI00320952AA
MPRHVPLDSIEHRTLGVETARGASLGDGVMLAQTFPGEFRDIQAHYPIVFHQDAQDRIQPLALFGLERGYNVFLVDGRWDAAYIPLAMERQPFLIGHSEAGPTIHVDLDSPRLRTDGGQPLFLEHGGLSPLLARVQTVLQALHDGLATVPGFVAALAAHQLLEPLALEVRLDSGRTLRLDGLLTIAEDRVRSLAPDTAGQLHAAGHLEAIHMAMASMSRLRDLIDRTNRTDGLVR